MAHWCWGVATLLSFLLLYLLNPTQARLQDGELYQYKLSLDQYDDDVLEFRPLVRTRRDDAAQNAYEPVPNQKPGKPLKKATDDKGYKKKVMLQKDGLGKTTTAAPDNNTPSATTSGTDNGSPSSTSAPTNTDTNATTTSTTTTTTTTTTSTTTVAPDSVDSGEENRTGGMANTTESEGSSGVTGDESTPDPDEVNDPDSGDDIVSPINGLNTTGTTVDHHRYYRSHTIRGAEEVRQYWVDFDTIEQKYVHNEMLSASHRRAATVTLTFEFPFYGHRLRNITIATGGFLFTGNFVHTWLAATQYIAPLMANFDTSMSDDASVRYADNGTSFTVQWNNVLLKDHADAGTFTFQVTLHKNGDIVFTYKQIPVIITAIGDDQHPVKVGLSDAYIVDRTIFFVRRKTIYEYHKIDMKKSATIGNWTAILFKALPTCVSLNSCEECLSQQVNFQCQWCRRISRCSNGLDRHRQQWLQNGCDNSNYHLLSECAQIPPDFNQGSSQPQDVDTFRGSASVQPYGEGSPTNTNIDGTGNPSHVPSTNDTIHSHPDDSQPHSPQPTPIPPQTPPSPTPPFYSVTSRPNIPNVLPTSSSSSPSSNPSVLSAGQPKFEKWSTSRAEASTYNADGGTSVGGVVGVVFLVAIILSIGGWVTYAYFFPHSPSGQMLIKYRPSTWSWRRGEARYTAAAIHSIHM